MFNHIESSTASGDAENDFAGLFDDFDVNSKAIGETVAKRNKVLVELLNGVAQMPLFSTDGNNPDLFGDAYEYLMGMYAANAGKKGGQYFTPSDVSELLARLGTIGKTKISKVYDPACGSGSLLLKVEKVLGKDNIERGFYGQEIDLTTYNLCRINMFLHNIEFDKFSIVREDTLLSPQHWDDQPFELIVSNPPFSVPWEGKRNATLINDPRFSPAGVLAPASNGDMAFIMHSLSWLANNGAAAIVCFPGIMYRAGAEQKIRKYLVDNNFVDAIIQLPCNLFLNVPISVDIMLLKKNKTDNAILFVDASREFVKVTKNNRLSEENMRHIVSAVAGRREEPHFARLVPNDEVGSKRNNYNLSVSTYVEKKDTREKIDIVKLNAEIAEIVAREQKLREEIDRIIGEIGGGEMTRLDELIQELCPDGVEYKTIGDVCKLVTGATPSKANPAFWEGGTIPWMSSGEVNLKRVYSTERKITPLGYQKSSTTMIPSHSVVIALAGQGKTRGKVAINEIELCTNQSLCSLICGKEIDYRFLYYYLDGKYEDLRTISNGDGSRGGLSLKIRAPYRIPVPPLHRRKSKPGRSSLNFIVISS